MIELINSDCLEAMKKMADNSIDFCVTDPPYGLSFMNKEWDSKTPGQDIWEQALRICKPGAMLAAFGGSRTHHHLMIAIERAGWEIRDCIIWLYGQGFPKSHNNFGLEGYGTALKPAYEPIILAMKPLDGTYAQNVQKWGLGGINIDACRIEINKNDDIFLKNPNTIHKDTNSYSGGLGYSEYKVPKGRWPANCIFSEEAAELLDQQSGILKSQGGRNKPLNNLYQGFKSTPLKEQTGFGDSGGASRFFYCAKSSAKERQGSKHPTIKPKKLIEYIIKLLAPPGNPICLDPFMGSGTCGIVCKELGIRFIGIELQHDYFEDAKRRIENAQFKPDQLELFTK